MPALSMSAIGGKADIPDRLARSAMIQSGNRITCRWSPPKPTRLTKEEKREYRSGRAAAVADAYGMRGRFGLIIER
jgi:hypothetical protein